MAFVSDVERILITSDWHVPFHNKLNVSAVFEFARDFKPHTSVIAGDFLDVPELSRHNKGSVAKLEGRRFSQTIDGGNAVLDRLDKALGQQCKKRVFMWGNHENRAVRWLESEGNSVFIGDPLLDIGSRLNLPKRKYEEIKRYPKGIYKAGRLRIIHGQYTAKHAAAAHVERLGVNVVFGHTHRSGMFLQPMLEGQRGGYALGHLADASQPELDYAGINPGWSEGFGIAMVRKSGNFQVDLLNFIDGVFYWGGQQYGELKSAA